VERQSQVEVSAAGLPAPEFATFRYVATVQTILLFGAAVGLTTPVWWGAISKARGYDLATFGTMLTVNATAAFLVGTLLVFYLQRIDRRAVMIACGLVAALVEVATIFAVDKYAFFAIRAIGAVATSVAGILGLVYLSYTPSPSRTYGWYTSFQTVVQSAGLFSVPVIAKNMGIEGLQLTLAGLFFAVAFLSYFLPSIPPEKFTRAKDTTAAVAPIAWGPAIPAMLAWLSFGFFTSDFFAYSERFGDARGLDAERIGLILAITMGAGLPASLFVSWLGDRIGKVVPVLIGGACGFISCLFLLMPEFGETGYWIALTVFSLVWSFVYPYLLALFADIDPVGRLLVATTPVRSAISVVLTGGLTAATVQYGLPAAAWLAALAIFLCPLFVVLALELNKRRLAQEQS
jgi:predicted MFS family arabinose efflux permease